MYRIIFLIFILINIPAQASDLPIFDAHVHYSHDAVEQLPPEQAAALLKKAGIRKALVSSSDDAGTQKLFKAAPDIIVPALRPYRRRGEISTWMHDPTVIDYLESNLKKHTYHAIGEFHAYGKDIETKVIQRMIALAKQYDLLLHAHSDADAVNRIFKTFPEARVLWAHSGFDQPEKIREMLKKHKNLWCDLAFRNDHASVSSKGAVIPAEWRTLFEEFPDRFMVGTDTFAPERWHYVGDHANYSRSWLKILPKKLAHNIAYRNAEAMLMTVGKTEKK